MARIAGTRIKDYELTPNTNRKGPKAVNPHSAWQLMIEEAREKQEISIRELATRAQVPSGSLFNWLRSTRGCPTRAYYTTAVNKRMATALKLKPEDLADAYNRTINKAFDATEGFKEIPAPHALKELSFSAGIKRLYSMMDMMNRRSYTLDDIKQMVAIIDPKVS